MITFRLNGKILDKVYILRGEQSNKNVGMYRLRSRYICKSIAKPAIVTAVGYNKDKVILFATRKEAERFRIRFLSSGNRRDTHVTSRILWNIVEYKPKDPRANDYHLIIDLRKVDDPEYGTYYLKSKIDYLKIVHYNKNNNSNNSIYNPFVYNESIDVIIENNDLAYKLLDLIDSEVIIKYVKEHYSAYDLIDIDWSVD